MLNGSNDLNMNENLHVFKIAETFIEIFSNVIELVSATGTTCTSISNNNCDDQIIKYACMINCNVPTGALYIYVLHVGQSCLKI